MKMNDLLGTYDQQVFISGAIYDQKHNSAVKGALVQIKRAIRA
jgi:protocatechuate 3,4-dioxygenase beta subunit